MLSSGVNEGFTQLVHVFVLQNNAHALCQWPCTVEIWRTFFGALGASAICSFSFPLWVFTTGCRGVVLLVLQRLVHPVGHLVTAPVNLFAVGSCL